MPPRPPACGAAVSACRSRTYVDSARVYSVRAGTPRYRAKKWWGKLFFRDLLARLPASQKETCQNLVGNEYILCVLWHACYTLWYAFCLSRRLVPSAFVPFVPACYIVPLSRVCPVHVVYKGEVMSERACKSCGEYKADSEYSVKCRKTGRLFPACKVCRSKAAKKTAKPADRDPKGHEVEPAERPADKARLPADVPRPKADEARVKSASADEALVEQAIEVLVKSADVPTKQTLCKCGRFQVLPGHERCLRCDRYC